MPDEDRRDLNKFRSMPLASQSPEGGMEALLAERVVAAAWRLRLSVRIEAEARSSPAAASGTRGPTSQSAGTLSGRECRGHSP